MSGVSQVHRLINEDSGCPHALQAYDQHLNMILGEVEETLTTVEIDDETYEEIIKARTPMPMP